MSSKGRSRGRKAAAATEVTQENIVDSTSTDKSELKVQDAAPEIIEKDKKGSKRKQVATENGTTETTASGPAKRGRGKAKEKESTPVEEEKPVPIEKETKPRRGGKKGAAQSNDTPVEKIEDTTTVETKPPAPVKKGRGKKAAAEPEPEPEAQAEPETQEEPEPKKSAKGKRGAKKEKVEESVEDEVAANGDGANVEKVDVEQPAEDEVKDNSPQQPKRGRGRKPAAEKEEKQPVKTAGAKKIVGGERSRRRAADSKEEEEKEEPAENGDEEEVAAAAAAATATATVAAKKGGRGRKRAAEPTKKQAENGTQEEDAEVITAPKKSKAETAKKEKLNSTVTNYEKIDFDLDKPFNLKISSWNVAGLRSWINKGGAQYIEHEKPDIICLQEIKCSPDLIPEEARISGYHPYWLCKPGGYAGVAIYSKIMPINVEYGIGDEEQDSDGRIMTAEYEKFFLIAVYVPNAGRKLVTLPKRMRWDKIFQDYVTKLNEKKPVIIAGDMNVSHQEIDLANPKTNKKNAGFTQEERDGMTKLLSLGFVDTFRHFYPDKEKAYTFWTFMGGARAKNVGWRLDYFIVSEKILPKVVDNVMRSQVLGSDHCPITLFLNL